jgi:hypothetical protein
MMTEQEYLSAWQAILAGDEEDTVECLTDEAFEELASTIDDE